MPQKSGILFYGDPHGCWQPLLDEYARQVSKVVFLLGDCELAAPLNEVLKPIVADGTPVFWIYGNHDVGRPHWWTNLTAAPGGLNGRVTEVAGLRIAGLGGIYASRVWYPKDGDEQPRFRTRRELLRSLRQYGRPGTVMPPDRRHIIFPVDHDTLRRLRADILVTHEAPTSHPHGLERWTI